MIRKPDTGEKEQGGNYLVFVIYNICVDIFRFIQEVGKSLGLRHDTMATASVYFHRFYMFHSFLEFPRYVSLQ